MEKQLALTIAEVNMMLGELLPIQGLEETDRRYLLTCGRIYLAFLQGSREGLSLILPHHHSLLREALSSYLHYVWIIYRLHAKDVARIAENCELLDYFAYRDADQYERTRGRFVLSFISKGEEDFLFEGNTRVRSDRFLPLFKKGTVENHEAVIYAGFPLFAAIARSGLLPHPVLIDLDRDSLLLLHNNMPGSPKSFLLDQVNTSSFDGHPERTAVLESLIDREVSSTIALGYPYHANIDPVVSRVMADRSRYFSVKMFSRLFYKDIAEDTLVLLPVVTESGMAEISRRLENLYQIYGTHHGPELYHAMARLRANWQAAGLNTYRYPFPSRWLMLVHQGEELEFYLSQAKADFPAVRGMLSMDFQEVIRLVYQVNWLEEHLGQDREATIVLPAMAAYPKMAKSVRSYLAPCFGSVEDTGDYCSMPMGKKTSVLLDPFNKVLIVNLLFQPDQKHIRLAVPDFIYYTCQPFMPFYIAKYIFEPLTRGASIDHNPGYAQSLSDWIELSATIVSQCRSQLSAYLLPYLPNPEIPELPPEEEGMRTDGLSGQEARELLGIEQKEARPVQLEITTADGFVHHLPGHQLVLVNAQGEILQLMASEVQIGQHFAPTSGFFSQIDKDEVARKLSQISEQAKNWKALLLKASTENQGLYATLKDRGLSVMAQTFETNYIQLPRPGEALSLPRSRRDWQIVGDYLAIADIAPAWVNHKGWSSQNVLRQAYANVVRAVLDYYSEAAWSEKQLIEQVNGLIHQIADSPEDARLQERDAKAIIELVCEHIEFYEITDIRYHEPR